MNAAIRAVVRCAANKNTEVLGVFRGWQGLIDDDTKPLGRRSVSGIINQGGTILKTGRCPEFHTEKGQAKAYATLKRHAVEGMIVIGGNGSFAAAHRFYKKYKFPSIGIPVSIDNDIGGINLTVGSDTAVNTALNAIDNIRDTATSMERIFVVEVMGRGCGYIALAVALGGGCENVIIPERKLNLKAICADIIRGYKSGKKSWIIVVAEGAGKAVEIAQKITQCTKLETRPVVLGHVQRGGRPTAFSRDLALKLGQAAVERLLKGEKDKAVALHHNKFISVNFAQTIKRKRINVAEWHKLIRILT